MKYKIEDCIECHIYKGNIIEADTLEEAIEKSKDLNNKYNFMEDIRIAMQRHPEFLEIYPQSFGPTTAEILNGKEEVITLKGLSNPIAL